jgi:hypothetical protein
MTNPSFSSHRRFFYSSPAVTEMSRQHFFNQLDRDLQIRLFGEYKMFSKKFIFSNFWLGPFADLDIGHSLYDSFILAAFIGWTFCGKKKEEKTKNIDGTNIG